MSSRSSCSETLRRWHELARVDRVPGPAGLDQDAGQGDQPGEALGPDRAFGMMAVAVGPEPARRGPVGLGGSGCPPAARSAARRSGARPAARPVPAQLVGQLGRSDDPGVLAQPEHPGDQLAGVGVGRDEHPVAVVLGRAHLAVAAEVALDLPGDPPADPHLRGAHRVAELPVDPVGVRARVEIGGALEVVLGLGGVADLALDPRQAEHPDRLALVRVADQVELAALEQQLVGIDPAACRARRAPSCSSRTRSSCGGRSRSRSWPGAGRARGRRPSR